MFDKFILVVLTVFFSFQTLASGDSFSKPLQNFTCVTELPTTSYVFALKGDKYVLDVLHHIGVEHAPIYSGLLTLSTLEYLQTRIANVKQLGTRFSFEFETSECIRLDKNRITCFKNGAAKLGPLAVKDVYFNVYENSNSSTYGVFKDVSVSLEYRQNRETYRMPMTFPDGDCSTRF